MKDIQPLIELIKKNAFQGAIEKLKEKVPEMDDDDQAGALMLVLALKHLDLLWDIAVEVGKIRVRVET